MYTITRSNGKILTTVQTGTINTTSTSIALPGLNYPSWSSSLMNSMVKMVENFADDTPPPSALKGQTWFNTNTGTLNVCPYDKAPANAWLALSTVSASGDMTLGNVSLGGSLRLTGNVTSLTNGSTLTFSNIESNGAANFNTVSAVDLTTSAQAEVASLKTATITAGSPTTDGTITGQWNFVGEAQANTITVVGKVVADSYLFSDGSTVPSSLNQYGNSNVATYLTTYTGNLGSASSRVNLLNATRVVTANLGQQGASGTVDGIWTLSTGSRLDATYADLAERYAADEQYAPGTVVSIGGKCEVTMCVEDGAEDVFGVVSTNPAYLMNAQAGGQTTHVAIVMAGRAPVRVKGPVNKGDRLVAAGDGVARAATRDEVTAFNVIGRALANKVTQGFGVVEAVLQVKL